MPTSKLDQVRALFKEGQRIEVTGTYGSESGGIRAIQKVGRSYADLRILNGSREGQSTRIALPTRVRGVLSVDENEATYLVDDRSKPVERLRGHTVTVRVLAEETGCFECGEEPATVGGRCFSCRGKSMLDHV